jgi:hypothetical protein
VERAPFCRVHYKCSGGSCAFLYWTPNAALASWLGGSIRPSRWEFELDTLACPREAAEPLSAEVHKLLQTFEFREPYRMDKLQSFGEKWAFRRTIGWLCLSGGWSSNEKSLLLLGLFAREFARRMRGLGQAGGARGIRTQISCLHKVTWLSAIAARIYVCGSRGSYDLVASNFET